MAEKEKKDSIYAIVAMDETAYQKKKDKNEEIKTSDYTILARSDAQLTYQGIIPLEQKPKAFEPDPDCSSKDKEKLGQTFKGEMFVQQTIHEIVSGPIINSVNEFYNFVRDYLSDVIQTGKMPKKLAETFYVYLTLDEANKQIAVLEKRQNAGYNGVYNLLKPYVPKQKLLAVDLILDMSDYAMQALQDIVQDPKAKKVFMRNLNQDGIDPSIFKNGLNTNE